MEGSQGVGAEGEAVTLAISVPYSDSHGGWSEGIEGARKVEATESMRRRAVWRHSLRGEPQQQLGFLLPQGQRGKRDPLTDMLS